MERCSTAEGGGEDVVVVYYLTHTTTIFVVAMFVSIHLLKLKANCLPNVLQLCADTSDNTIIIKLSC